MAKIKVAFDANPLVGNKTGVGQLTEELIVALAKRNPDKSFIGHYFDFLNRKNPSNLPSAVNITYKKTTFIPTKFLNLLRRINISLPFEFFCRIRPDVILFPNFVSSPSMFNAKKILFIYDLCYVDFPEFVSDKNSQYLRKWVKKSINTASNIITISEFTKSRIIDVYNVSPEIISVIPVPPKKNPVADKTILSRLDLENFLLFVGTLEPRKNILNLLNSYEALSKDIHDKYPLVLVGGKGWKDENILNKIDEMSKSGLKVIQAGYVSDAEKVALYESSTLVLQLSHYEGFGMPVLEAMSYGKPVMCSDIPVFHEIAGDNVEYVDKDNPIEISEEISRIVNDSKLQESLSKKGLSYANEYPDWDNVAEIITNQL